MTRSRAFDEQVALDSAMRLFWRHGYNATSMQMLVDATGLNRSSLYLAFGDKEALFLAAIENYLEHINGARVQRLKNEPSARKGIEDFFRGIIEFATGEGRRLGCLLTNSAIEKGATESPVQQKIYGVFSQVENCFTAVIERGQAAGEISLSWDARHLARFLITQIQGIRVISRLNPDRVWLESVLGIVMNALESPCQASPAGPAQLRTDEPLRHRIAELGEV